MEMRCSFIDPRSLCARNSLGRERELEWGGGGRAGGREEGRGRGAQVMAEGAKMEGASQGTAQQRPLTGEGVKGRRERLHGA